MTLQGWHVGEVWDVYGLHGDTVLVRDGTIEWLGWHRDLGTGLAIEWQRVPTALIVPGFVDAHVHLTATGVASEGLNLSAARSGDDILSAVRIACARLPQDATVFGHGWDDTSWSDSTLPSASDVSAAAQGRRVYLSRIDVHSALVSTDLLDTDDARHTGGLLDSAGSAATEPSALVRKSAHGNARQRAFTSMNAGQREHFQRLALTLAAGQGITSVHENGGPIVSSLSDLRAAMTLGREQDLPEVVGYWGALGEAAVAQESGAVGAAGDLFIDGSIGSETAHLCEPYVGSESVGATYVSREQIAAHLMDCLRVGVQAGFHVIGDAAMGDICWALDEVASELIAVPAAAVRLEHAEMISPQHEQILRRCGVALSMQPMFDRHWGGPEGMYARRLGLQRASAMNRIADHINAGLLVGFGSDSPVTQLGPWQAMSAAVSHQQATQRVSAIAALAAHTVNAHALARRSGGVLRAGFAADFGVWNVSSTSTPGAETGLLDTAIQSAFTDTPPMLVRVVHNDLTMKNGRG